MNFLETVALADQNIFVCCVTSVSAELACTGVMSTMKACVKERRVREITLYNGTRIFFVIEENRNGDPLGRGMNNVSIF